MKTLLDNRFAPVTFNYGFIECPFLELSQAFTTWQRETDSSSGTQTELRCFQAPLGEALLSLEPLTSPLDRYLLVETRSAWTAIFANGLRVSDVFSPVSFLPTVLKCRGLEVVCVPDRSDGNTKDAFRVYGAVVFSLYGSQQTDWLNRIRHLAVTNDVRGWEFVAQGEIQLFEKTENYQKRRIQERFTPEMLESYCAALGIRLLDADSYGGKCLLSHTRRTTPAGPTMSISEARSRLYL